MEDIFLCLDMGEPGLYDCEDEDEEDILLFINENKIREQKIKENKTTLKEYQMSKLFRLSSRQLNEEESWKKNVKTPRIAVSGIVQSPKTGEIIIVKRKYPPLGFAFPGGMVELGETIEEAVIREIKEETNIDAKPIGIIDIVSNPKSDPRFHVVIIHIVMESSSHDDLKADDDALEASWEVPDNKLKSKLISSCKHTLNNFIKWKKDGYKLMELG